MTEPNVAPRSFIWSPLRWLLLGEILIFAFAVPLAMGLHAPPLSDVSPAPGELPRSWAIGWQLFGALAFGLSMTATLHALGMHLLRARRSSLQLLLKYCSAAAVAAATLWLLLFIAAGFETQPWPVVATALAFSFAMLLIWRMFFSMLVDSGAMQHNVLVLGAGQAAAAFNDLLRRRADRRGLRIVGYLPLASDRGTGVAPGILLHARTSLARTCQRNRISEIVIASDDRRAGLPVQELLECRFLGTGVIQAASFIERECGKIPLELVEPSWWLFRGGFAAGFVRRCVKRAFDLFAATLLLIAGAPVLLICACAIVLEDGPRARVLYRQARIGLDGRVFQLVKFRSMREDAEHDGVARWANANDERVTRVGAVLRKARLDELPQLFNVIRGEMSLVGPRPERPEFVAELTRQIPYYKRRHAVRPGITGWAQLSYPYGASVKDAREKLKYDLYYIKNRSLGFDIAILLRTVEVVLFGKGAR